MHVNKITALHRTQQNLSSFYLMLQKEGFISCVLLMFVYEFLKGREAHNRCEKMRRNTLDI